MSPYPTHVAGGFLRVGAGGDTAAVAIVENSVELSTANRMV